MADAELATDPIQTTGYTRRDIDGEDPERPNYVYLPLSVTQSDREVGILDYWRAVRRRKFTIFFLVLLFGLPTALYLYYLDATYVATAGLFPADDAGLSVGSSSMGDSGSSRGSSVQISTGSSLETEALAILKSRAFTMEFVRDENLIPILFEEVAPRSDSFLDTLPDRLEAYWQQMKERLGIPITPAASETPPTLWDAFLLFNGLRELTTDRETGVITLSVRWRDPVLAAQWANGMVERLNRDLKARDISVARKQLADLRSELGRVNLLALQGAYTDLITQKLMVLSDLSARDEYALRLIDPAVPPTQPEWTMVAKAAVLAIAMLSGIIFGALLAILGEYVNPQEGHPRKDLPYAQPRRTFRN